MTINPLQLAEPGLELDTERPIDLLFSSNHHPDPRRIPDSLPDILFADQGVVMGSDYSRSNLFGREEE